MIILGLFWGYHHLRKHPYVAVMSSSFQTTKPPLPPASSRPPFGGVGHLGVLKLLLKPLPPLPSIRQESVSSLGASAVVVGNILYPWNIPKIPKQPLKPTDSFQLANFLPNPPGGTVTGTPEKDVGRQAKCILACRFFFLGGAGRVVMGDCPPLSLRNVRLNWN